MTEQIISTPPLRTKDGSIRVAFVRQVARAIDAADVEALRGLVGDLHESDLGAVLEALEPEQPPAPGRIARHRLRFHRAHRGRRRGARGNPRRTAAANRRGRRARHRIRRRGGDPRGPAEGRAGRDPRAIAAARARRAQAQPRLSGGVRRPAHADGIHRRAAGLECRPGDRLHARDRRTAGALLQALRDRRGPPFPRRGAARPAAAQQAAGADFRSDGGRKSARCTPTRTRRRWRGCSSATTWWRRRWSTPTTGWSASSPSTTSPT